MANFVTLGGIGGMFSFGMGESKNGKDIGIEELTLEGISKRFEAGDYKYIREVLVMLAERNERCPINRGEGGDYSVYQLRESIIGMIVKKLGEDAKNMKGHMGVSALCTYCPQTRAIRAKDKVLELTAQRIAWELYVENFGKVMRWAAHSDGDPFYKDSRRYVLTDTEATTIDVYRYSAEKQYRNLLQNLRADYSCRSSKLIHPLQPATRTLSVIMEDGYPSWGRGDDNKEPKGVMGAMGVSVEVKEPS